ncbi:MAG: OmpP1/FadL family transporter [Roseibacillus sp.]
MRAFFLGSGVLLLLPVSGYGNGVLRWGFGAADSGAAGVFGGTEGDSLAAMQLNPAAMTSLVSSEWSLSARALVGEGNFDRGGGNFSLDSTFGVFPEAAVVWRVPNRPLWLGASLAPVSALEAEWNYLDIPAEGSGVSYGDVGHESGFLAIKANAGMAWKINEQWSVGGSVGAVYSRVIFDAPFIFQTNSALAGAKVDLDLETDGWSFAWDLGVVYQPVESLRFGARFRPEIELSNEGSARGDFSAQLPGVGDSVAYYEASSRNVLPMSIGVGFSWQATDELKIGGWAEWYRWSSAFDTFAVNLSQGSNSDINGAIGTDAPSDRVPLNWDDRFVIALGAEYQVNESWVLRGGWRYGESPIPTDLVTPLNASINEHAVTLGVGWRNEDWRVDASYGIEFSPEQKVRTSGYRAAEYSNSSLDLAVHSFGLGVTRSF